jgi:hypothetical protein
VDEATGGGEAGDGGEVDGGEREFGGRSGGEVDLADGAGGVGDVDAVIGRGVGDAVGNAEERDGGEEVAGFRGPAEQGKESAAEDVNGAIVGGEGIIRGEEEIAWVEWEVRGVGGEAGEGE